MAREDIMVFSLRKVTNCIPNVQNVRCKEVLPNLMPCFGDKWPHWGGVEWSGVQWGEF